MFLDRGEIERLEGPLLVVGAGSFVGSALMRALCSVRTDVVGICRSSLWRLESLPQAKIELFDLRQTDKLRNLLRTSQPATIFYCVAYGGHPTETNESLIFETQVELLAQFKSIACEELKNLKAFIHAGTSSEYGFNSAGPHEDQCLLPDSSYSSAKGAASLMLSAWGKTEYFPCLNLRLYSVYGPYEDPSRLLPQLIFKGLNKDPLRLTDPQVSRDFVFVDDVCRAFFQAALNIKPELYGGNINIGTGRKTTIADLVQIAARQNCFSLDQARFGEYELRSWDRDDWFACIDSAESLIGWKPRVTLEEGLLRVKDEMSLMLKSSDSYSSALKEARRVREVNRVSIVVACYKDLPSIQEIYESFCLEMGRIRQDFEILFVNDASPDLSSEKIIELSKNDKRVRGIVHARSFGSQAAFLSGMEAARGEAIVLMDGDQQDPPEVARQLVEKWKEGASVVVARRVRRIESGWLQWCRKSFYRLLRGMAEFPVDLDVGDFALFDRRVKDAILRSHQAFPFLRLHRSYAGFEVQSVDYVRPERKYGRSTNSIYSNLRWALLGFVSSGTRPLRWGIFSLLASLIVSLIAPSMEFLLGVSTLFSLMLLLVYVRFAWPRWVRRPLYVRAAFIENGEVYKC